MLEPWTDPNLQRDSTLQRMEQAMPKALDEAEARLRQSRNAMDASTFGGRMRTEECEREVHRLRDLDTSKLGPIRTMPMERVLTVQIDDGGFPPERVVVNGVSFYPRKAGE